MRGLFFFIADGVRLPGRRGRAVGGLTIRRREKVLGGKRRIGRDDR
jgi:hypothetical protein